MHQRHRPISKITQGNIIGDLYWHQERHFFSASERRNQFYILLFYYDNGARIKGEFVRLTEGGGVITRCVESKRVDFDLRGQNRW